jgi:hypothetical protein
MVIPPDPRPTLVLNPADDEAFASTAEALVEGGIALPSALQLTLRHRWPLALVRPRELAGEPTAIWYVYRDGRWVHPDGTLDPRPSARERRHD